MEMGRSVCQSVGQTILNPGFRLDDPQPYLAAKTAPYQLPKPPVDFSMELRDLAKKLVKTFPTNSIPRTPDFQNVPSTVPYHPIPGSGITWPYISQ